MSPIGGVAQSGSKQSPVERKIVGISFGDANANKSHHPRSFLIDRGRCLLLVDRLRKLDSLVDE
jgi:hypothetical protein